MASPLYFFAGRGPNDLVDPASQRFRSAPLESAGLTDVFRDVANVRDQCVVQELARGGPGGKSGLLVIALPPSRQLPPRTGFYPEFQTWQEADEGLWIGTDREQPVRPADLLREGRNSGGDSRPLHGGYEIQLADGHVWTVPVVRRPAFAVEALGCAASDLPHDIGWARDGRFTQTLKREYQQLWEDTAELCDRFFGAAAGASREITVEDGLRWAIRLLSLNYRYGRHEQNLLHAVDAENVWLILGAAVDYLLARQVLDAQKKTSIPAAPAPPSTAPGSPADSPTTDRAAENFG